MSLDETAWIKLALLAKGVTLSSDFGAWFVQTKGFVLRRNFYNTPIWSPSNTDSPPQEIRLGSLLVAINIYGDSPWQLALDGGEPVLKNIKLSRIFPISMIADLDSICEDEDIARICNLYGGSALSFFSPRACYFFADGIECKFCSLAGTAQEKHDFASRLTPAQVKIAVARVLDREPDRINQVMIVGGNERNLDNGFQHHVELVKAVHDELRLRGLENSISIHLATMPPRNLDLLEQLCEQENIHVMFNLEVWGEDSFSHVVPGKDRDYGRKAMLTALRRLCSVIGEYKAHSILIAGLEPSRVTLEGARALADLGVSPIINAYHSDRHSRFGLSIRPAYSDLATVAYGLQKLYDVYPIEPYWHGCGRNAMDFEASLGMFRESIPDWLE